jgi:hypothetical protein
MNKSIFRIHQILNAIYLSIYFRFIGDRVSLCSSGWPGTHKSPASAFQVLVLQVCSTMPSILYLLTDCIGKYLEVYISKY